MAGDDDFDLWLGKISPDRSASVSRMLARARRMGGGGTARGQRFTGERIGRGSSIARVLGTSGRHTTFRARRVVVKARIVKLAGKGAGAAAAHLRYLQRDGTTRENGRGSLYGASSDQVDGRAFLERGAGDRHHFRFIVSPEDGAQYDDLKPLIRRLMQQVEKDLGTRLDWVAVDHFNTGHPHSHFVLRGKDDRAEDLIIAKEYYTQSFRIRAIELVNLDLGPRSDLEIAAIQTREMTQERFTEMDRVLLRDADESLRLDAGHHEPEKHALRMGRLQNLERLSLASRNKDGSWTLNQTLEQSLRRMSERSDIIRIMDRELRQANVYHSPDEYAVHDPADKAAGPITGRVVSVGLSDEHRDRRYVIIDGLDGQGHYADIGNSDAQVPKGSIITLEPRPIQIRNVDRSIVAVAAANAGRYDVDAHLRHVPTATDSQAEAHVRRLEAIRRAMGTPERQVDGSWRIDENHLATVEAYEQQLSQHEPLKINRLSARSLDMLPTYDGQTWLDHELVNDQPKRLEGGFGREVKKALERRRLWLVEQELASVDGTGTRYRRNMLQLLRLRELERIISTLESETGLTHSKAHPGERIEGIYRRNVAVGDAKYAFIEKSREFTLVPWREVLERGLNKQVSGIMREQGISWSIGRSRGISR